MANLFLLFALRVRVVEYSKGYVADHWCEKGHIVFCLEGEFINELKDGTNSILSNDERINWSSGRDYFVLSFSLEEGVLLIL